MYVRAVRDLIVRLKLNIWTHPELNIFRDLIGSEIPNLDLIVALS